MDSNVFGCSQNFLVKLLHSQSTFDAIFDLSRPVTLKKIKNTMFAINGDKAFRPDGFSTHIFKVTWSIVGDNVVKEIMYFFQTKKLLLAFNDTIVALVPNRVFP